MKEDVVAAVVLDLVLLDVTIAIIVIEVVLVHLESQCKHIILVSTSIQSYNLINTLLSRSDMDEQDINPGDNLFITGLSIRTTGADLEALFEKYGKVSKNIVSFLYDW